MEMRNMVAAARVQGLPAALGMRGGVALKRFIKNDPRLMGLVRKARTRLAGR